MRQLRLLSVRLCSRLDYHWFETSLQKFAYRISGIALDAPALNLAVGVEANLTNRPAVSDNLGGRTRTHAENLLTVEPQTLED